MDKLKFCCSCTKEIIEELNVEVNELEFYEMVGDSLKEHKKPSLYQKIKCFFGFHLISSSFKNIVFTKSCSSAYSCYICQCCNKTTDVYILNNEKHPELRKIMAILYKDREKL